MDATNLTVFQCQSDYGFSTHFFLAFLVVGAFGFDVGFFIILQFPIVHFIKQQCPYKGHTLQCALHQAATVI